MVDAGAMIEIGRTEKGTGLGEENSILWGHVNLRKVLDMVWRCQLDIS